MKNAENKEIIYTAGISKVKQGTFECVALFSGKDIKRKGTEDTVGMFKRQSTVTDIRIDKKAGTTAVKII